MHSTGDSIALTRRTVIRINVLDRKPVRNVLVGCTWSSVVVTLIRQAVVEVLILNACLKRGSSSPKWEERRRSSLDRTLQHGWPSLLLNRHAAEVQRLGTQKSILVNGSSTSKGPPRCISLAFTLSFPPAESVCAVVPRHSVIESNSAWSFRFFLSIIWRGNWIPFQVTQLCVHWFRGCTIDFQSCHPALADKSSCHVDLLGESELF